MDVRACGFFKVALLIGVTAIALASGFWSPRAAASLVAVDVEINDFSGGGSDSYSQLYYFSDPRFAPDGGGLINATVPGPVDSGLTAPADPVTGADYTLNYSYDPTGHHLGISFTADGGWLDTTFSITATSLAFGPDTNPPLIATGTLNASDVFGTDGLLAGAFPGGNSFQVSYGAASPTEHVFATLINDAGFVPLFSDPHDSITNSADTGYVPISGTVGVLQSQWDFTLVAGGSANGTSEFDPAPVPEPSSLALLALGSLAVLAARRRFGKG